MGEAFFGLNLDEQAYFRINPNPPSFWGKCANPEPILLTIMISSNFGFHFQIPLFLHTFSQKTLQKHTQKLKVQINCL